VSHAAPDGYTWLAITLSHAANATLFAGKAGYDLTRADLLEAFREALAQGADLFMRKPYRRQQLLDAISQVMAAPRK